MRKTTPKPDPRLALVGKTVVVKRSKFALKFKITQLADDFFSGPITEVTGDCPYHTSDVYAVSDGEIKYHIILSK